MPTLVSVFGVEPFRIGGTEAFARELSRQLAEVGWKSVLCFQSAPPEDVRAFLDLPNTSLEVVGDTSSYNATARSALSRVFKQHKPDIVHFHFTGFLGIYPWLAKLYFARKVFFTDHSSRPAGYVPQAAPVWKKAIVRMINLPFTKVICVSGYGYRCMTTLGLLPQDRFELVYNAVDLARIPDNNKRGVAFRKKYSIPDDSTVVIQVSWIIPEKGIPDILEAAKQVVSQNSNVRFVLVGEGSYRPQYMERTKELGLEKNVIWTGLVDDPFSEGVYEAADIICQVSRWEELFGWMIAEGMAHAKPVVATRVGGIPELVVDGESGFLVERGNATEIADRILALVKDPALRTRMGENGQQHTRIDFDLRKNVSRLIQAYNLSKFVA